MGIRKKAPAEMFSWTTIAVSLALLSGMVMGHITEQSMHPRLSASPPADPVERYALGQNAYATSNAHVRVIPVPPPEYTDASHEIGRYKNGARILVPAEPARKNDRLRLERLQDWNEQSFGSGEDRDDGAVDYADSDRDDYAPIDVGAVEAAPEVVVRHAAVDETGDRGENSAGFVKLDGRMDEDAQSNAMSADAGSRTLSYVGKRDRPVQKVRDLSYNPKTPSIR